MKYNSDTRFSVAQIAFILWNKIQSLKFTRIWVPRFQVRSNLRNQAFYMLASLFAFRRRAVIRDPPSRLLVSAFIALHRRVLRRIWQKSGLNPTRDMHARAGTSRVTASGIPLTGHPRRDIPGRPTPLGIGGEGRVIRHLPFHYCFARDTAAWHAIARSIPPLVFTSVRATDAGRMRDRAPLRAHRLRVINAPLRHRWTDRDVLKIRV